MSRKRRRKPPVAHGRRMRPAADGPVAGRPTDRESTLLSVARMAFELTREFLHHHLILSLAGAGAIAAIVLLALLLPRDLSLDTSFGELHLKLEKRGGVAPSAEAGAGVSGLHGTTYTDPAAGFMLE